MFNTQEFSNIEGYIFSRHYGGIFLFISYME